MIYELLVSQETNLAVVGLGYVGMPLAVQFAKQVNAIGFDTNEAKIELYKKGIDPTGEVGDDEVKKTSLVFTSDEFFLKKAKFFVVAVPTPVKSDNTPDLSPVVGASEVIGRNIQKGSIVVYESTVYPGVTEKICVPIIERLSGLKCGRDWKIGYSPERINPGDKTHRVWNIRKIVSGMDAESLDDIAKVYSLIIKAGVYPVSSIRVAEAAKVVENSQRDINIAFMNEIAVLFHRMGIDTKEVIDAMNTKWNALGFKPGLVGGHCIGVDPYYLTAEAEQYGYHSRIILAGRRMNDDMGQYIADSTIKQMIKAHVDAASAHVLIMGMTFKENCSDTRNSKVFDIYKTLLSYGIKPLVFDPVASAQETKKQYGIDLVGKEQLHDFDCVIVAVAHEAFSSFDIGSLFKRSLPNEKRVIIDVKSVLQKDKYVSAGYSFWRL